MRITIVVECSACHRGRGARLFNCDALAVAAAGVVGIASKVRRRRTTVGYRHVGAVA